MKFLQMLTGYLNFLTRAIVAGRMFTRCMYAKFADSTGHLKQHHHVRLDGEFKLDCEIWRLFLTHHRNLSLCRPMVDSKRLLSAQQLDFWSDASANESLGIGAVFGSDWLFAQWEPGFIKKNQPSIEYLELFGVVAALMTWGHLLRQCIGGGNDKFACLHL